MRKKQGISLIVLVITIIVMIILAASVVITLNNTGIIDKAGQAVSEYNLSEIQNAAQLAWADAYLNGKRESELSSVVETEIFKLDKDYKEKYNIVVTDKGVEVTSKNGEWLTIYSGGEMTENGELKVADRLVFNEKDKFRITISGPDYTGTIEINRAINAGVAIYLMAVIDNGKVITFNSIEDAQTKIDNISENAIAVIGEFSQDENGNMVSILAIEGESIENRNEYKIEKIEVQSGGKLLFNGYLPREQSLVLSGVDLTNEFTVIYNGNPCLLYFYNGGYIIYSLIIGEPGSIYMDDDEKIRFYSRMDEGVIEIYSTGKRSDIVVENAYAAQNIDDEWKLIAYPSTIDGIPQTVAGKTITSILVSNIKRVYYDREIYVDFEKDIDDFLRANIVVAPGVNPQKIFDGLLDKQDSIYMNVNIDLSALNNVTIPESIIELYAGREDTAIFYVSPEVKAKYSQSYIVAK